MKQPTHARRRKKHTKGETAGEKTETMENVRNAKRRDVPNGLRERSGEGVLSEIVTSTSTSRTAGRTTDR